MTTTISPEEQRRKAASGAAAVRHLKVGLTVLLKPGEKLELMPTPTGYRLYARTPKTKTWREIAREGK